MSSSPGQALLALTSGAQEELLLVAPYIKVSALERVLDACPRGQSVSVVTRWRLDELALGVSDIEIWPLLRARGHRLSLHSALHAKYYATGGQALVGSANLTNSALGWRTDSNLEILVDSPIGRLTDFERELGTGAIGVDDRLYESFRRALIAFPPPQPPPIPAAPEISFVAWRPMVRHPEDLELAYLGRIEELTTSSRELASADIMVLRPPIGLDRQQFRSWVAMQLRQHPEVAAIDKLLDQPRRFGELRTLLTSRGAEDGARAWQTWMRWLLYFLGDEYVMKVANYSEIFSRTAHPDARPKQGL